jgi:cysteinyl-tRNA synthetase
MPLRLYNTLTRQKEDFAPIDPAKVRLYACGPTVYDYLHIGNGRMLIVFDVLFRLLRHVYGEAQVKYVRNITDVDDKINARAAERGVDIRVLTDEMTKVFHEDAKALGCLTPTDEPRATEHIVEMIALIEMLIAKGHAYVAEGHVLFDVPSMPAYGKLSKRPLDEMIAGARVEVAPYKRGPMDFVLWKPSSPNEPGWESPWGRGRPGWHIECSAMSWKLLGKTFDIHGGGIDLVFPHHENEMAQSCSAFGHDVMAKFWMHNGNLQVEGQKMSKSLKNCVTIHELLHSVNFGGRCWPGEVLRLAILKTHYRRPIDFTVKALEDAERRIKRWCRRIRYKWPGQLKPLVHEDFLRALKDDLNTHKALALMGGYSSTANFNPPFNSDIRPSDEEAMQNAAYLLGGASLLGLDLTKDAEAPREESISDMARVMTLSLEYDWARAAKNSAEADRIRKEVAALGVDLPNDDEPARKRPVSKKERAVMLSRARERARASKNWVEADRIREELDAIRLVPKDNKYGPTKWEVKQ